MFRCYLRGGVSPCADTWYSCQVIVAPLLGGSVSYFLEYGNPGAVWISAEVQAQLESKLVRIQRSPAYCDSP